MVPVRQAKNDRFGLPGIDGHLVMRGRLGAPTLAINRVFHGVADPFVDSALDVLCAIGHAPEPARSALVFREVQVGATGAGQPVLAGMPVMGMNLSLLAGGIVRHPGFRPAIVSSPCPRVAKPKRWEQVKGRRVRPGVRGANPDVVLTQSRVYVRNRLLATAGRHRFVPWDAPAGFVAPAVEGHSTMARNARTSREPVHSAETLWTRVDRAATIRATTGPLCTPKRSAMTALGGVQAHAGSAQVVKGLAGPMTSSTESRSITVSADDSAPAWHVARGERIALHTRPGSTSAAHAPDVLRVADQVVTTFTEMLDQPAPNNTALIGLYLEDPDDAGRASATPLGIGSKTDGAADVPEVDLSLVTLQSDDPPRSVVEPLVTHLVRRWFGDEALEADVMVTGLVGVTEARVLKRPLIEEAHAHVRDALLNDRNVSIFSRGEHDGSGRPPTEAATSFVAYLIDIFGAPSIGRYLATYDPRRTDAASVSEYYQPLGSLEEDWLGTIRHEKKGGSAFGALFRQLVPLVRPNWVRAAELLVLMVLGVGLTIAAPLTIMYIVDHILPHAHGHYDDLFLFVALLLILFVLNAACGARRNYVQNWITEQSMMTLHHRLFGHLQRLSHNFYSRTGTSQLMTVLTDDLREIRAAIVMVTGNGLYQLLLAACTAITVLVLDPLLGLLVLVIVPVFAAGYVALRARWQREAHGFQRLQGKADHIAHENFSAHGEIEAFGLQDQAIDNYRDRHEEMVGRQLRLVNLSSLFESTLHIASGLGYAVVFGFGGYQYIAENGVTLGTLFAFAHLLPLFY